MMENKKVVFKWFTIPQYRQEEEYLSSMHENGWKLTKITFPGFYHFEKCKPAKVTYRLDYNQDSLNDKAEYVKMFSDCGWHYLFDFVGYSYFYTEDNASQGGEEIFCDDASRLDMMHRVFKGRIIPLIIIFLCGILPQLCMNTIGYGRGGIIQEVFSITFLVLTLLYLGIFAIMTYQFYEYEKKILSDKPSVKYKYVGISVLLLLFVVCIGLTFYFSKRSVYTVSENVDGFTIEAERLNKAIEKEYYLKEGSVIEVSHDYEGGRIYISVGEENKDPIFYGNSYSEIGDFALEIQEDGYYIIKCSGQNAMGTIQFVIK